MEKKLISVVIPTYNEEKNIVRMAQAIRQMYPDFRILFMDDNSTDRGKELIDTLNDPLTQVYVRDPNDRGLGVSVLEGFRIAETDESIKELTDGKTVVKTIAVPGRLINLVVK